MTVDGKNPSRVVLPASRPAVLTEIVAAPSQHPMLGRINREGRMTENGRGACRYGIEAQIKLRRRMESAATSAISDLSLTGFRVRTHMKLAVGSDLSISLPGIEPRWATVVWVREFEAGCSFHEPLHVAVLDNLISSATPR